MPTLTINGHSLEAPLGATLWEAAHSAGIEIPTLCHHPDLSPVGSCRLCLVQIAGRDGLHPACTCLAEEGLAVTTESPALAQSRRGVLELLLASYRGNPARERGQAETEFERWVRVYGAKPPVDDPFTPWPPADSDPHPLIRVDWGRCILCTRCVRACQEVQGRFVWGVAQRGPHTRIVAGCDTTMLDADCESCGACVAYCPTGALDDRLSLAAGPPDRLVRTTCSYCGVGCQFDLNVRDDRVVRVTSTAEAPVNGHALCVKGRYGFDYIHHPDRLARPRVRRYLLDGSPRPADRGPWVEVDWDRALGLVARRFAEIRRAAGPAALGFLASAKCTNEENYLVQKLARQLIGTHNVDHCARLCHSSTVAGLSMAYGSGAMSNSMDDVCERAAAFFVIGSNTTEQHPVFGTMLRQAVLRRRVPLVLADPRRIELADFAAIHLRQRPGSDVALLNGLARLAIERGWHDEEFIRERCEGFETLAPILAEYTPRRVDELTGVAPADLERAAELISTRRPMAAIWAMGITQHTCGVLNVLALANLQMLLGNVGVPGGGVNPLRGQNNVQGACDMGALPNLFPGYQGVADAAARQKFAAAWRLAPRGGSGASNLPDLPAEPGLTVTELIAAAGRGELQALYILGEDPAMTEPDSHHARQSLARAPFVVLQEIFPSETADYADVLLPGVSFAEKSGTFTNTERRVQLIQPAVPSPGEARPDWRLLAELGQRLLAEFDLEPRGPEAGWDYADPAAILAEAGRLTPSYAGISHARLARGERLQWPVPSADHPGTPILHVGRFTRGKGKFHAVEHLPPEERPCAEYPRVLTTGRVLYHWHGGELTRRSAALLASCPEPVVEVSPADAARAAVREGSWIRLRSRRGELRARCQITDRVGEGVVFANFHFPGDGNANNLTIAALDPIAKIPEYKVCAVALAALDTKSLTGD